MGPKYTYDSEFYHFPKLKSTKGISHSLDLLWVLGILPNVLYQKIFIQGGKCGPKTALRCIKENG